MSADAPADAPHAQHDDRHTPVFVGDRRRQLDELAKRYPTKRALLLPALWMVQHERGWISEAAMAEVAEVLELTPAYVKGVVSFYTMYHQHPVGKHFIQVCTTSPCAVCGAEEVRDAFLRHTGCEALGVTSEDGKYTVIEVECLAQCDKAPAVMVNDDDYAVITKDKLDEFLKGLG